MEYETAQKLLNGQFPAGTPAKISPSSSTESFAYICSEERERFLNNAFSALMPVGRFFLSFFNINIVNYLKGDIYGDFCSGKIPYERFCPKNIIRYFPKEISIDCVTPMNIFHKALPDRLLSRLPLSILLSRMVVISGFKRFKPEIKAS